MASFISKLALSSILA